MPEFHAEAPQATASEGLAQGPYVTARAGFDPATLRRKGDESTNVPPRFTNIHSLRLFVTETQLTLSPFIHAWDWHQECSCPRMGFTRKL